MGSSDSSLVVSSSWTKSFLLTNPNSGLNIRTSWKSFNFKKIKFEPLFTYKISFADSSNLYQTSIVPGPWQYQQKSLCWLCLISFHFQQHFHSEITNYHKFQLYLDLFTEFTLTVTFLDCLLGFWQCFPIWVISLPPTPPFVCLFWKTSFSLSVHSGNYKNIELC